jgi:cold shock CspA family protein
MRTVKWYNVAKGFGFIVLDGGGNDVFVHASALQRAGIMGLSEGQRVFVGVAQGQRGPEARLDPVSLGRCYPLCYPRKAARPEAILVRFNALR